MDYLSQLIIIGNGFDLHCGLKSSYKNFFRNEILNVFSEQCGYPTIKNGCEGFWEELLFHYYLENENCDYLWCEIETIIKTSLFQICFGDDYNLQNIISNGIWKKAFQYAKSLRNINEDKNFENAIKNYIFNYLLKFFIANLQYMYNKSDREIMQFVIQHLLEELNNFEIRFCNYIKKQIFDNNNLGQFNENYIVNSMNLFAKIIGIESINYKSIQDIITSKEIASWGQDISSNTSNHNFKKINILNESFKSFNFINILSFNYTHIFDILDVKSPCQYNNVHGKICNRKCQMGCRATKIIFGIDDYLIQKNIETKELCQFSKTYRKMSDTMSPINILPNNEDSSLAIKFYGHSLSEADYSYFQSIFDYYNLYSNGKLCLIFYYSKGFEQKDAIYNLINTYGKTLSNPDQGKNLMHKLILENRLKIVEID